MPKMTKTQARKRLTEAHDKLGKVYVGANWGDKSQFGAGFGSKLVKMIQELQTMANKLK